MIFPWSADEVYSLRKTYALVSDPRSLCITVAVGMYGLTVASKLSCGFSWVTWEGKVEMKFVTWCEDVTIPSHSFAVVDSENTLRFFQMMITENSLRIDIKGVRQLKEEIVCMTSVGTHVMCWNATGSCEEFSWDSMDRSETVKKIKLNSPLLSTIPVHDLSQFLFLTIDGTLALASISLEEEKEKSFDTTVYVFDGHTEKPSCIAFQPSHRLLAIGYDSGCIRFFHIHSHRIEQVCQFNVDVSFEVGTVQALSWSGNILACGWKQRGFMIVDSMGRLIRSSLPGTWMKHVRTGLYELNGSVDMGYKIKEIFDKGCSGISWIESGLSLLISGPLENNEILMQIRFAISDIKNDITSPVSMLTSESVLVQESRHQKITHISDHFALSQDMSKQLCISDVDDSIDFVTDLMEQLDRWNEYTIPSRYKDKNFPITISSVNIDGSNIAVAGKHGISICNCSTHQWRVFGNICQEAQIEAAAIGWLNKNTICIANQTTQSKVHRDCIKSRGVTRTRLMLQTDSDNKKNDQYCELLFYPKKHLDHSSLLHIHTICTDLKIISLEIIQENRLILQLSSGILAVYVFYWNTSSSSKLSLSVEYVVDCGSILTELYGTMSFSFSRCLILPVEKKTNDDEKEDEGNTNQTQTVSYKVFDETAPNLAFLLHSQEGDIIQFSVSSKAKQCDWIILKSGVTKLSICDNVFFQKGLTSSRNCALLSSQDEVFLWIPDRKGKWQGVKVADIDATEITVLGVSKYSHALVAASSDVVKHQDFADYSIRTTNIPYLHALLQHLMLYSNNPVHFTIADFSFPKSVFLDAFEVLLLTSLIEGDDSRMKSMTELISHVCGEYQLVVYVNCARKSAPHQCNLLFTYIGEPKELFEQCLKVEFFDMASLCLSLIQRFAGSNIARKQAFHLLSAVNQDGREHTALTAEVMRFVNQPF